MSDYFDPYEFYDPRYNEMSDENDLSSQLWDLYAPTSDTQAWNRINAAYPYMKGFSTDAFLQSDPLIRGTVGQAMAEAGTGTDAPFVAYNLLQSDDYQKQLQEMLGRTEWNDIANRGDIGTIVAMQQGDSAGIDQAAMDYTNGLVENFYAQAVPSAQRNMGMLDEGQARFGGRPYPGGDAPQYSGAGFGGGQMGGGGGGGIDMNAVMANPAYANAEVAGQIDPRMLGNMPVAPGIAEKQYAAGSQAMYGGEPILDLGKADVAKNRIVENAGPEGYSNVAVIGGRKYALPDTLPGVRGTSISYMEELRRQAEGAGLEMDDYGRFRSGPRVGGGSQGGVGSFGGSGRSPLNNLLDRVPGLGQLREGLRDRIPALKFFR